MLLPGLDAQQTPVGQVMTGGPVTVKPDDQLEGCMAIMAARLSPSTSAGRRQGRGRDLDRRRRQGHHPKFGAQRGRPDGLHHDGRPRGRQTVAGAFAGVREGKRRGTVNGHPPAAEETASSRLKQMF